MKIEEKINKYPIKIGLDCKSVPLGIRQSYQELIMFCEFLINKKIETYLEIGLREGALLHFMIKEMGLSGYGVTKVKEEINNKYLSDIEKIIIFGNSQDEQIIKKVKELNNNYDLIFVDGDHSYKGVKSDYDNYKTICKWMAFHDIGLNEKEGGTKEFWSEIKKDYEYYEFIADKQECILGIGVIKMK